MSEKKAEEKIEEKKIEETKVKKNGEKGIILGLITNPTQTLEDIVNKNSTIKFMNAILLVVFWTLVVAYKAVATVVAIKTENTTGFLTNTTSNFKVLIEPALSVILISILFSLIGKNKKSLSSMFTLAIATKTPTILASCISLLNLYSSNCVGITSRITILCNALTTVFVYFSIKAVSGKETEKEIFKEFLKVELLYLVFAIIFAMINVNI